MGRRRRNAYWSTAGGATTATQIDVPINLSSQVEITPVESPSPDAPPATNTRRSLRQQAKKAAQISLAEDDLVDEEFSDEDLARFTPLPAPRKRFLKDKGKKKGDESETTATVLNRLIGKQRVSKPGYVVKAGRFNVPKNKSAGRHAPSATFSKKGPAPAAASLRPPMPQLLPAPSLATVSSPSVHEMPLKVEIQEGVGSVSLHDGPKKRGRKRKVDQPVNLSMKVEPGVGVPVQRPQQPPQQQQQQNKDPDWDPNANVQRKRGRQSAATANVKNRFPFCSLCLSKTPPNDYIINYMSCPNEYQRMKRLFMYIYKDLKFPFMPFDLERETVFDYCDLPLCDCCIQLYREIYDSYSQIETARDQLKAKIERMVYQIQLSEQNPAVAQQLSSIKNSPDTLMNKYCNFRRRFATYKPGDSRGEVQGAALVPATIARIKVINQTPKRTAGTQTFLTAGQFPTTTPTLPTAAPKVPEPAAKVNTTVASSSSHTASPSPVSKTGSSNATVTVKQEVVETPTPAPASSKPQANATSKSGPSAPASKASKEQPPQKPTPKTTPTQISQVTAPPKISVAAKPSIPPVNPIRPPAHASVLTIIKTPGGGGPAIIRKLPPAKPSIITQTAKLLAIATPTHKLQANRGNTFPAKPNVNGTAGKPPQAPATISKSSTPDKPTTSSSITAVVKDEPVEEIVNATEEEQDPFFSSDPSTDAPNPRSQVQGNTQEDKISNKDDSTTIEGEESSSQQSSDTNVFHKHKKLRVLPVPSYSKESSNDSSDNIMTSNDKEGEAKVNDDGDDGKGDAASDDDKQSQPSKEKESESTDAAKSSKPESPTLQEEKK